MQKWKQEQEKKQAEQQQKYIDNGENARKTYYYECIGGDFSHPYLEAKHIKKYDNMRLDKANNRLVIPLLDARDCFWSLQYISADGQKRFFTGAKTKGVFYSIGLKDFDSPNTPILLGEGVATVATVYELLDCQFPVVAAMNCNNLLDVAKGLKERYPKNSIIIIADNDLETEKRTGKNPGISAAQRVVNEKLAIGYAAPPFNRDRPEGSDWNDAAIIYGYDSTLNALKQAINNIYNELKRKDYISRLLRTGTMVRENFATFCKPPAGSSWLIQDWIPTESLAMLFAPSGSGKGFIALDLAFSIACPLILKWHDFPIVKHGPVVYLAGEGQRGMRKRAAGLASFKNIPHDKVNLFFIPEALPLDDKNPIVGAQKIIANIGSVAPNPALIIIDTTNRYMAGDENKTVDATIFINACTEIMREFKRSTVLIIHHTGQAMDNQGRARGSSVFKAAMDMEYKISKSGNIISLSMTKSKDTEEKKSISFKMKVVKVPGFFDSNGIQETTCVLQYDPELSKINDSYEQEEQIAKSEKFARDTYTQAAMDYGVILTDNDGNKTAAVKIDDWRKVFFSMSAADSNDAKRSLFSRTRRLLLENKQILMKKEIDDEEFYCVKYAHSNLNLELIKIIKDKAEI